MDVITLDAETFYDTKSGYSLAKLPTEDYVTDSRFEFIGVAARVNDVPAGHIASDNKEEIAEWLRQFDIENMALAGHHLMFDGLILAHHFGRRPAFYCCTESMCRPFLKPILTSLSLKSVAHYLELGEKGDEVLRADGKRLQDFSPDDLTAYMSYCENDVALTRDIYLWARPRLSATEMRLISMTLEMYLWPMFALDAPVYERGLHEVRERKAKILAEMEVQGVTGEVLRSSDKFAALLRERGIEPPMKVSPTSLKKNEVPPKMICAFGKSDPEFIALREEYAEDLEITMLLNARVSEKGTIEETRNEALLELARRYPKFRIDVSYYAAHTGRYTSKEQERSR